MRTWKEFSDLIGVTITEVEVTDDSLKMKDAEGSPWVIEHTQDCCESVWLEDVCGDPKDLIGTIVRSECNFEDLPPKEETDESYTWSFVRIGTNKGTVVLRFYGTSNGYYSETPDLYKFERNN